MGCSVSFGLVLQDNIVPSSADMLSLNRGGGSVPSSSSSVNRSSSGAKLRIIPNHCHQYPSLTHTTEVAEIETVL